MSMRAARFSQADIARAVRAADKAGTGRVVEIAPDGTIRLVPDRTRLAGSAMDRFKSEQTTTILFPAPMGGEGSDVKKTK
jgi:hypothetical protein